MIDRNISDDPVSSETINRVKQAAQNILLGVDKDDGSGQTAVFGIEYSTLTDHAENALPAIKVNKALGRLATKARWDFEIAVQVQDSHNSRHTLFMKDEAAQPEITYYDGRPGRSMTELEAVAIATDLERAVESQFPESTQGNEVAIEKSALTIEQITQVTHPSINETASIIVDYLNTTNEPSEEKLRELWIAYAERVEVFIDPIEDSEERSKANMAADINKAIIFRSVGNTTRYLEELDSAEVHAANEGFTTLATTLDAEIKTVVETLDLSPEKVVLLLRGVIRDKNREFLKDSIGEGADLQDIIGDAYGMILEEGEDPDQLLFELGITE